MLVNQHLQARISRVLVDVEGLAVLGDLALGGPLAFGMAVGKQLAARSAQQRLRMTGQAQGERDTHTIRAELVEARSPTSRTCIGSGSERIWFFNQPAIWKHQLGGQLRIAQMFIVNVQRMGGTVLQ